MAYAPLKQSDWSSGYGQQVWSDSTKFNEYYHVKYGQELTIPGNDTWYDPAYKYRRRIEIDNSEQGELDHFPVLVILEHKVNIDYLKAQSDDGYDLRFTDSDGTTLIPHDVERWDQGGKSYIWVKIPQIKDHQKDYFYMYYGNPNAVDSRNPGQVWDNGYVGVWNLNETPSPGQRYSDSSTRGNNGTFTNDDSSASVPTEGQIAQGVLLDRSDHVEVSSADSLNPTDFTVSVWIYPLGLGTESGAGGRVTVVDKRGGNSAGWRGLMFTGSTDGCTLPNPAIMVAGSTNCFTSGYLELNKWQFYNTSFSDARNEGRLFKNGQLLQTRSVTGSIGKGTDVLRIGSSFSATTPSKFYGTIDDIRISNVYRSPDWISAEYKSETNTYLTFGNEELFGSELVSSIFDAGKGMSWGYLSYDADEPDKTAAKIKVRTGNDRYLADAPEFTICDSIINKTDISSNNCVKDGDRYIQYQAILESTEINKTPTLKSVSITDYLPQAVSTASVKGVSTQLQVTPNSRAKLATGQASHQEQENNKPKPTAQAGPRPSPSPSHETWHLPTLTLPTLGLPTLSLPTITLPTFLDALIH